MSSAEEVAEIVNDLSDMFDKLCRERHEKGLEEYGPFTFLGNDVIRMMAEELADITNYCRMEFVKLMLLQNHLEALLANTDLNKDGDLKMGIGWEPMKGTKDVGWPT